ncbi:hypothetical protein [Nannocystis sp. SCPEA4]|uniref:hypothetical protein n=1 Tax=Nannocystis sp. SCPEA4 TaxID=2996787 RepID=UPI00226FD42A|nr:hypothetical protein [Nannocystis sp. SCPEA4]MCY1057337.1 hypothetical protein [Nannocystis sp. SCPEA4]
MTSLTRPVSLALAVGLAGCPGDPQNPGDTDAPATTGSTGPGTGTSTDAEPTSTAAEPTTTTPTTSSASSTTAEPTSTTTSGPEEAQLWIVQLVSPEHADANSVILTAEGDVVVAGMFAGSLEFAGQTLTSHGLIDLFVARFSPTGELVWAHAIGGAGQEHEATVSVGSDGRVLLSGEFSGTLDVPGLPSLVSQGASDILLLEFAADGTPQWARGFGGPGVELEPRAHFDPAGDIILSSGFEAAVDLGGGPLVAEHARDLLLARLDPAGEHVWSRSFANSADIGAHDLSVSPAGDIAIAGWFGNTVDFGGGPFAGGGGYVAVFAGDDGAHLWSRQIGGDVGNNGGCGVRFAADGGLLLTGWYQNTVDLGGGPLASVDEDADHFSARYKDDGAFVWGGGHGGPNVDSGCGVGAGPGDSWVLGGTFNQEIDLGGGPLTKETAPCAWLAGLADDGGHRWSLPLCAMSGGRVSRLATHPDGQVAFVASFAGPIDLFGQALDAEKPYSVIVHAPPALLDP